MNYGCSSHLDSILDSKSHCIIIIIIFSDLCICAIYAIPKMYYTFIYLELFLYHTNIIYKLNYTIII